MTKQTEALRLADALDMAVKQTDAEDDVVLVARWFVIDSSSELRRLAAERDELLGQALDLIRFQREWINAVPPDAPLPAMPGFDGDWAEQVIASLRAHRETK